MSSYTMTLGEIVDQYNADQYHNNTKDKIEFARKKIFDFDYEIFDPNYKKVFETHFIRHFYMREIGFETDGLFKFRLETWLLIHMPYFNKMFESELIKFDPLNNTKLDLTHNLKKDRLQNDERNTSIDSNVAGSGTTTNDGTSVSNASGTSKDTGSQTDDNFNRDLESNNPDSRLTITTNDGQGVIEYANKIGETNANNKRNTTQDSTESSKADTTDHATSVSSTNVDTDTTQKADLESKINDIEDFVQYRVGKVGIQTYSEMLMLYRKTFLRLEQEIFDEMQELFMLVY